DHVRQCTLPHTAYSMQGDEARAINTKRCRHLIEERLPAYDRMSRIRQVCDLGGWRARQRRRRGLDRATCRGAFVCHDVGIEHLSLHCWPFVKFTGNKSLTLCILLLRIFVLSAQCHETNQLTM